MEDRNFLEDLKKVEEVESIIKQLTAEDETERKSAELRCDEFLTKHGIDKNEEETSSNKKKAFNKTVINEKAFNNSNSDHSDGRIPSNISQDAFMAAVEADVKARAARRKEAEKVAQEFKDRGNKAFAEGDFNEAVTQYTEAIYKVRDWQILYTNRAQAYIKLERHEEAIEDCDWALKVSEDCVKAYIHKGRAYLAMKRFEEAINCFEKAISLDEKNAQSLKEQYLMKAEVAKKWAEQEELLKSMDNGDTNHSDVEQLINKINLQGHIAMYYTGGLNLLAQQIDNNEKQIVFRCKGGFHLMETNSYIKRCLEANPRSLTSDELDICQAVFALYEVACKNNEENQCALLKLPNICDHILKFMDNGFKLANGSRGAAVNLIYLLSTTEMGRAMVLEIIDHHRLLESLLRQSNTPAKTSSRLSYSLLNFSLHKRFQPELQSSLEALILPFMNQVESAESSVISSLCTILINLCANAHSHQKMAHCQSLWSVLSSLLSKHLADVQSDQLDCIMAIMGLIANLATEKAPAIDLIASPVCLNCLSLLDSHQETLVDRSLIVIGRLLMKCKKAAESVMEGNVVDKLVQIIKNDKSMLLKSAIRTLTVCTQVSSRACNEVVNLKALKCLADLIRHPDEVITGNAALCISHCLQVPKVAAALVKTEVVRDLLSKAGDGHNSAAQVNSAVLLAKLTQADVRHLERLRELNGLKILHDVQKYINE